MKEMRRTTAIPLQTILSPVISTMLYFIVFGSAIGGSVTQIGGVTYAQFIVPGLIMMALIMNSLAASSSGIFFPKFMNTIYEILSAPLSYLEITLGYVLSATTRALIIAIIIYLTALFFTPIPVAHPFLALGFGILTALTFALFGFILGIWAENFDKLNVFPMLIITPLSFLGGIFYSLDMLSPLWQKISLINPVVYMISGLRWSFFGVADINPWVSVALISVFLVLCSLTLVALFRVGYKLKD
jgi:ABC-2 type transport system permease protein